MTDAVGQPKIIFHSCQDQVILESSTASLLFWKNKAFVIYAFKQLSFVLYSRACKLNRFPEGLFYLL